MVVMDNVLDGFCSIAVVDGILFRGYRKAAISELNVFMAVVLFADNSKAVLLIGL